MRWFVRTRKPAKKALNFCKARLRDSDDFELKSIRIEKGVKNYGVYGWCDYDASNLEAGSYYLVLHIPGPFPHAVHTREPKDTPLSEFVVVSSRNIKRTETVLQSRSEGLVWLFGHEFFHFLASTNQVDLQNTEYNADHFAHDLLLEYRQCQT